MELFKTDLRCLASGGPGEFPQPRGAPPTARAGKAKAKAALGAEPWRGGGGDDCQRDAKAPPTTRSTGTAGGFGLCFQEGRGQLSLPPWYLDASHSGLSRRPRCPGAGGSPFALGGPALHSLRLGLLGTKPTLGSAQRRHQTGHWGLAVLWGGRH